MSLEFHEIANVFPLVEGAEFDELVADIREYGLREPIVIYQRKILDGRNRYRACLAAAVTPDLVAYGAEEDFDDVSGNLAASEGETEILWASFDDEVARYLGDLDDPVAFVVSLNLRRRHLDETQRSMAAARLATLAHGQKKSDRPIGLSQDDAAAMLNVSPRSVRRAAAVQESGAPELVQAVDRGAIAVSTAADIARLPQHEQREIVQLSDHEILQRAKAIRQDRAVERQQQNAEIRARQIELPNGLFDVVVIDPPWPMEKIERDVRPNQARELDYPVMQEEELAALNIPADEHCHVWLWTTHRFLPMAFRLLDAWQLRYVCSFVWHKPGGFQPIGLPQYNCEFALYARRGSPSFISTKAFPACFDAPRGEHSEKPEEFYELLRRVTEGRRLDMFNRRSIDGFTGWGKEAEAAD